MELIINREIFKELNEGDYVNIYDPNDSTRKLVLRVAHFTAPSVRKLDISILKTVAEPLNVKPFSRVCVEKVHQKDAEVDFVELAFKKQFLQRGNLWRFKNSIPVGQTIHIGGFFNFDGVNAQIQEIGKSGSEIATISGIITEKTHFIFRSRSTRIIWLVQISKEMFECDQNNDLYFEKFLSKFVEPLLDQWKSLGVTHLLSVIFFARTLYPENVNHSFKASAAKSFAGLHVMQSLGKTRKGIYYKDFFKTVIDSATEYDKKVIIRTLKEEFWDFPRKAGWNIGREEEPDFHPSEIVGVPSDASGGNFLEAINSTLNFLDKHYLDRDLQRTGNSIVMISAGTGIFRVRPELQQITKQRMMDNGIGMDFISLSQPPLHTVPLFLIECSNENGTKDFYEVPHWMNITFVDCDIDPSASIDRWRGAKNFTDEQYLRWRDPTDPRNRSNPRWTGLEGILMAEEEMGGKFIVSEGFLQYVPPENTSKYIGRKYESTDIWRDETEFQRLPFAHIISGFTNAHNASEGHTRGIPPFLKRLINRGVQQQEGAGNILQWGWIVFDDKTENQIDDVFSSSTISNWAMPFGLPDLPLDKTADTYHGINEETVKYGSSFEHLTRRNSKRVEDESHITCDKSRAYVRKMEEFLALAAEGAVTKDQLAKFDVDAMEYAVGGAKAAAAAPSLATADERPLRKKSLEKTPSRVDLPVGSFEEHHMGASTTKTPFIMRSKPKEVPASGTSMQTPPARECEIGTPTGFTRNSHGGSDGSLLQTPGFQSNRLSLTRDKSSRHPNGIQSQATTDSSMNELSQQREFIRTYRKKYAINPFKKEEGKAFLETRTHNRRRWSHVFPAYSIGQQDNANTYFGLNKKSLTQPAILPMTTDFVPAAKELQTNYDNQSEYTLAIYTNDCPYNNQESLLKEMVCQRLSMEYQLVDGVNPEEYTKLNRTLSGRSKTSTYILTMGHRIHILAYDASGKGEIVVTRFLSKRGTNSAKNTLDTYKFEVWVPHTQRFQTVTQTFFQYPQPEYWWNRADEILLGNEELDTDTPKYTDPDMLYRNDDFEDQLPQIKSRKLGFTILPPESFDSEEDLASYVNKVELFLAFMQKSSTDFEKVFVMAETPTASAAATNKPKTAHPVVWKLYLKGSTRHENPKWIYMRCDNIFDVKKAYHIQLHWLVCDALLIEDFITGLFRKCFSWNIRIIQTPEFFRTSNLQIHPFRALPQVDIPFCDHPSYSSCVLLVEKLFFKDHPRVWLSDGEYLTDWKSLGLSPPAYEKEFITSEVKADAAVSGVSALSNSIAGLMRRPATMRMDDKLKPKKRPDRQYIHRNGYVAVRLAPQGFIWLFNRRPRTNENLGNVSLEERKEAALQTLRDLECCCETVGICASILFDVIDEALYWWSNNHNTSSS